MGLETHIHTFWPWLTFVFVCMVFPAGRFCLRDPSRANTSPHPPLGEITDSSYFGPERRTTKSAAVISVGCLRYVWSDWRSFSYCSNTVRL